MINDIINDEDREFKLLTAIHEFLQDWTDIAGTRYSGIFKISESGNKLKISKASMKHLNCNQSPLVLQVDPVPIDQLGLTRKVWIQRESQLSFLVESEGNEECAKWWGQVAKTKANQRFFAGALIKHTNPHHTPFYYGVLTINGEKPFRDVDQFSMGPSIMPMLEIIAEELGKQLYIMKHGN